MLIESPGCSNLKTQHVQGHFVVLLCFVAGGGGVARRSFFHTISSSMQHGISWVSSLRALGRNVGA